MACNIAAKGIGKRDLIALYRKPRKNTSSATGPSVKPITKVATAKKHLEQMQSIAIFWVYPFCLEQYP